MNPYGALAKFFEGYPDVVRFVEKVTKINVVKELRKREKASGAINGIIYIVILGVVLMVAGICLGNLEQPLQEAIPDNSSFSDLKTYVPHRLAEGLSLSTIIIVVLVMALIISVLLSVIPR